MQVECGQIGAVVIGIDDGLAAGSDSVTVDVVAGRAGQHDAGPVVVREHQWTLNGAAGQDDPVSANFPQTLRRVPGATVGKTLFGCEVSMIPSGNDGGA